MPNKTTTPRPAVSPDTARSGDAPPWTPADAALLYGTGRWGGGYVSVDHHGHVRVHPHGDASNSPGIDLPELVEELRRRDVATPVLLRFPDIIDHRMSGIAAAFASAIAEFDYAGSYRGVYPIKVNQQRHVVEDLVAYGREHGFGLEAGSKPELLAVLALVDDPDTLVICNGFKDARFIEAVVLAQKVGRNVVPVVEKFSELRTIIEQAAVHGLRPKIGVRIKLASAGSGRWHTSGGERSKFGLFVNEVLDMVELLRQHDLLDGLTLVHFHLGSQINDMRALKAAIVEGARLYAGLLDLGAGLRYLDVGGGLGVDYDGTASRNDSSVNYTLQEYANNVVFHIGEVCRDAGVNAPVIVTEAGRAMVAHHSVLVTDVAGWSNRGDTPAPPQLNVGELAALPGPVQTLYESLEALDAANLREYLHDAEVARDQARSLFSLGYCSLTQRGLAERLFAAICTKAAGLAATLDDVPDEVVQLTAPPESIYFCNFSVFQSAPDSWAIGQLFPVMPIHRLDERPMHRGVLADITCDSDGKIDRFVAPPHTPEGYAQTLPLHAPPPAAEGADRYLLGVFMVGAYQETLGDLHNLFGDTNAVHVTVDDAGRPCINEVVEGDTASQVLSYVQFDPAQLRRRFRAGLEAAVRDRRIDLEEANTLRRFYEDSLNGYTYLT